MDGTAFPTYDRSDWTIARYAWQIHPNAWRIHRQYTRMAHTDSNQHGIPSEFNLPVQFSSTIGKYMIVPLLLANKNNSAWVFLSLYLYVCLVGVGFIWSVGLKTVLSRRSPKVIICCFFCLYFWLVCLFASPWIWNPAFYPRATLAKSDWNNVLITCTHLRSVNYTEKVNELFDSASHPKCRRERARVVVDYCVWMRCKCIGVRW